jgi:hypothetical protein
MMIEPIDPGRRPAPTTAMDVARNRCSRLLTSALRSRSATASRYRVSAVSGMVNSTTPSALWRWSDSPASANSRCTAWFWASVSA